MLLIASLWLCFRFAQFRLVVFLAFMFMALIAPALSAGALLLLDRNSRALAWVLLLA